MQRAALGELAAGTVDSWLIWQLTGGRRHVTDYTNASRTLLFNARSGRWDESLCDLFGVPAGVLAQAQPSVSHFGTTTMDVIGAEIPITGVAGDQQSALFGQACLRRGQVKNTYGTGCFIVANAGPRFDPSQGRLLVSIGTQTSASAPEYVLEGSVFVAGSLVQWLRDELGIIDESAEIEGLAASVDDSGGVSVVPAFTGLGAPYWDPYARGAILGLTRGSTKAHIARASLEAIALSNAELLAVMERDLGTALTELRVDGGASANNLLMQLQADFSGLPVVRPTQLETTALGAAYLAALGAGVWDAPEQVEASGKRTRSSNQGPLSSNATNDSRPGSARPNGRSIGPGLLEGRFLTGMSGQPPASVDIAIIGGGINGTAIAAMAAKAGLRVALLEATDFGFGTTWRTTKLIHGGLRYLEHGDVPLVFESLHERSWLLKTRPYLVRPQRFVLPILPWTRRPAWQLRTGLALYDALALYRGVPQHRRLSSDRAHTLMPALSHEATSAFTFFDARLLAPERLALELALEARAHGAFIANQTQVRAIETRMGASAASRSTLMAGP